MGVGPFAYVTFIVVFLKFNDAAYDTRQSVHKTMGVLSYMFILVNQLTGSGMLALDLALFLFASFFFYRAMSDNFESASAAAVAVMLVFGSLYGYGYWSEKQEEALQAAEAAKKGSAASQTEAELKKALETATKALQQAQQPLPDVQ